MTIPDVNILLYAVDSGSEHHDVAREWLTEAVRSCTLIGLPWAVVTGFLRIATNPRIFPHPFSTQEAAGIIDRLLALPAVRPISPGDGHWTILKGLLADAGTAGNLTTDAHLAALAIERGASLVSADNDFARFRQLKFVNILTGTGKRR